MTEGEYVGGADGNNGYWLTDEPIVRCRDCSHQHYNPICGYICDNFGFVIPEDNLDGFCAWGERSDDHDSN